MTQSAKSLNSKAVLVVEDDRDIRTVFGDAIEAEGFRVLLAANGREGLDLLQKAQNVGLVLLDLMMPVMNGRDF